jgi:type II secretory pathway pseudopilin PulG
MELVIVIGLMSLMAVLIIPAYGKYRQRMEANAAAQELVSDLRALSSAAAKMEDYCICLFVNANTYYLYQGGSTYPTSPKRRKNMRHQYPRAAFSSTVISKRLTFGQKGWVDTSALSGFPTDIPSTTQSNLTVYNIYVHAWGISTFKITVYQNGKISLEQRNGNDEW